MKAEALSLIGREEEKTKGEWKTRSLKCSKGALGLEVLGLEGSVLFK